MLDLEIFKGILQEERCGGKRKCRLFLKKIKKKMSQLRRLLESCPPQYASSIKGEWLTDNFSRLESVVNGDTVSLGAVTLLVGENKYPLFYNCFSKLLNKEKLKFSEGELQQLFDECNAYGTGISLGDTQSLMPLLRIAVCMKIVACFLSEKEEVKQIEALFFTLDELLNFDERGVFCNSGIEKTLLCDPYGLYERLTEKTKAVYRKNLIALAKKKRISQRKAAEDIVRKCKNNKGADRHIGKYLCDRARFGGVYIFLVFFLTSVFTLLLCMMSPLLIISFFSVYTCSKLAADKIFTRFFIRDFSLPSVELEKLPEGHGVMTVITSLLCGDEKDDELFERLENMYHSNGTENAYFGLLCDLSDSDEKETAKDREIIERAAERILSLRKKYGNYFFFFVREREYSVSEQRYIAPERKRGAVNALTCFLCGKSDGFAFGSIKPEQEACGNIRYVFTLDADTNPGFDCLRKMVGIMLHPQNKPVVDGEKNAVTKGYGILQPAVNTTLDSASKSFFSSIMCGHGGVDLYSSGGSDRIMSLFGRSIFCGKGMFDKNCYYKLLCADRAFAKEKILSHDAPEGARLRCAYVPDVTLTDAFPCEPLSYYKRQHRWIRGDIQNIPFLLGCVKTADGGKIKNGIGVYSRLFIWENVHNAMLSVFTLIMLFMSPFCEQSVGASFISIALAAYVLPFVNHILLSARRGLWQGFRRVYFSLGAYTGVWISLVRMLFSLSSIPKSACVSLDAAVRSLVRGCVTHRKMLEWTTAAQNDAEKKDGLAGYVKKNLVNAVCGALLFVLSDFGILKLLALLWFFMPVLSYHAGKTRTAVKAVPDRQTRDLMKKYFGDMWDFFSENVSAASNHLPTDNVSFLPEKKTSKMTSPTNIGLYLLSVCCSGLAGFIDETEMCTRIEKCLESVMTLEKHRGLLYNWYDVFRKEPMKPRYISSVDMGNFAACLVSVKEGVRNMCGEKEAAKRIVHMCERLLEEADFELLFDRNKMLFYIGAQKNDTELLFDRNRYDMLMSEARILSFYAVSSGLVPSEHLRHLSRRFVKGHGYMGLASWSGTAFEFFMPEIFMPSENGSLLYEAMCFAYTKMKQSGVGKGKKYVFGISESCYNEIDSSGNYKYFAFGVPEIAISSVKKQNVISPYSSFLFLKMAPGRVFENLKRLEGMGAYGRYGFYESVDFERREAGKNFSVVRSYMSHHVGMSIAALTNYMYDGAVSEWFFSDNFMKAARELTGEKIPYDAYISKHNKDCYIKYPQRKELQKFSAAEAVNYAHISFCSIEMIGKKGKLRLTANGLDIAREGCFAHSLSGFEVAINIDGESFYFNAKSRLSTDTESITYHMSPQLLSADKFTCSLTVTPTQSRDSTVKMRIRLRQLSGEQNKNVSFSLSFYPLLDKRKNSTICFLFDNSDCVVEKASFGNGIFFERFSENMNCFASCTLGKNKKEQTDNEKLSLMCTPVKENGVFCCEFALSVSRGSVSFSRSAVRKSSLRGFDDKGEMSGNAKEKPAYRSEGKTAVLGCSTVRKANISPPPAVRGESCLYLMASEHFSALIGKERMGASFIHDINSRRITHFSGTFCKASGEERLVLDDGFDLLKNSKCVGHFDNMAEYEGEYDGKRYTATFFVSSENPCKFAVIKGAFKSGITLEFLPSAACDGKRYIGAGIVFFGRSDEEDKGYSFGVCMCEGKTAGAEYSLEEAVNVKLPSCNGVPAEYIFCIGKSSEEGASEIFRSVTGNFNKIYETSLELSKSLKIHHGRIGERIAALLGKYYAFPRDNCHRRVLVKTDEITYAFDCLVLMYTDFHDKKKYLVRLFESLDLFSDTGAVMCLALCEYVRITGDYTVIEEKICDETPYKKCLSFLYAEVAEVQKDVFTAALEEFSLLCEKSGDLRTAVALKMRAEALRDAESMH